MKASSEQRKRIDNERSVESTPAQKRSVKANLKRNMATRTVLSKGAPRAPEKLIAEIADDLSDIYEISQRHIAFIANLLRLRLPREKETLESLLIAQIDVELLFHCDWHVKSLKYRAPRFWTQWNKGTRRGK